ncbi:MAG: hypothetical protein U0572_18180 [Phycisphaerales bacterium]
MKTDASTPAFSATKLAVIVKRHSPAQSAAPSADPVATLVHSFLLWEASTQHAGAAMERIAKECVDFNELRVCLPEEIVAILGPRYPYVEERANRLRRSLNDLYRREHKVSFEHVSAMGKREQRTYVENLDGMIPFVASRVLLFHFGHAGVPADDQLVDLLRNAKALSRDEVSAIDLAASLSKAAGSLEESTRTHLALVAFADSMWAEDAKSIAKAKQVRVAAQRATELKAAKAKLEAQKLEAAKAEAQRLAEEKAAAAARKPAKPEPKPAKAPEKPASKVIEAKPGKGAAKAPAKEAAKPAPKAPAKPLAKPAAKAPPPPRGAKLVKIAKPVAKTAKKARK